MGTSNSKPTMSNLTQPQSKLSTNLHHGHHHTTPNTKEDTTKSISEVSLTEEKPKRFDPRLYRPLDVTVSLTIHDIQAHLVKVSVNVLSKKVFPYNFFYFI